MNQIFPLEAAEFPKPVEDSSNPDDTRVSIDRIADRWLFGRPTTPVASPTNENWPSQSLMAPGPPPAPSPAPAPLQQHQQQHQQQQQQQQQPRHTALPDQPAPPQYPAPAAAALELATSPVALRSSTSLTRHHASDIRRPSQHQQQQQQPQHLLLPNPPMMELRQSNSYVASATSPSLHTPSGRVSRMPPLTSLTAPPPPLPQQYRSHPAHRGARGGARRSSGGGGSSVSRDPHAAAASVNRHSRRQQQQPFQDAQAADASSSSSAHIGGHGGGLHLSTATSQQLIGSGTTSQHRPSLPAPYNPLQYQQQQQQQQQQQLYVQQQQQQQQQQMALDLSSPPTPVHASLRHTVPLVGPASLGGQHSLSPSGHSMLSPGASSTSGPASPAISRQHWLETLVQSFPNGAVPRLSPSSHTSPEVSRESSSTGPLGQPSSPLDRSPQMTTVDVSRAVGRPPAALVVGRNVSLPPIRLYVDVPPSPPSPPSYFQNRASSQYQGSAPQLGVLQPQQQYAQNTPMGSTPRPVEADERSAPRRYAASPPSSTCDSDFGSALLADEDSPARTSSDASMVGQHYLGTPADQRTVGYERSRRLTSADAEREQSYRLAGRRPEAGEAEHWILGGSSRGTGGGGTPAGQHTATASRQYEQPSPHWTLGLLNGRPEVDARSRIGMPHPLSSSYSQNNNSYSRNGSSMYSQQHNMPPHPMAMSVGMASEAYSGMDPSSLRGGAGGTGIPPGLLPRHSSRQLHQHHLLPSLVQQQQAGHVPLAADISHHLLSRGGGGGGGPAMLAPMDMYQEWMSQQATRLVLPHRMREVAELITSNGLSPMGHPPYGHDGGNTTGPGGTHGGRRLAGGKVHAGADGRAMSGEVTKQWREVIPAAVLNGCHPPSAIQALAADQAFMASLLASLPGVDPAAPALRAVLTALEGRNLRVEVVVEDDS